MNDLRTAAQQALEPVAAVAKNATAQFDHGIGADRFKVVRGAYWWHVLIGDSQTKRGKFYTQAGAEEMAALLLREFRNGAFVQHEAALAQPAPEPVAWECKAGGLRRLTQRQYDAQPDNIKRHYTRIQPVQEPDYWQEEARRYAGNADYWRKRYEALAEPVQEPVALDWLHKWANQDDGEPETDWDEGYEAARRVVQIHLTAPPQRKPLTDEEMRKCCESMDAQPLAEGWTELIKFARAIERAHGIF